MPKINEPGVFGRVTGGLMLDMPVKNPRKKKQTNVGVGDEVRGVAVNFTNPVRGVVLKKSTNTIVIKIENTFKKDKPLAMEKNYIALMRFEDVEILKSRGKRK